MTKKPARRADGFFLPLGLGMLTVGVITLFTNTADSVAHIFIGVGAAWIALSFVWRRRRRITVDS